MRPDETKGAKIIDLDRCYAASDRQIAVSRRTQALLAAAGMDEPARRWFVIRLKAGMDEEAAQQMQRSGIEVWMPVVMVVPKRRSGMGKAPRAAQAKLALKGLLFARVAATDDAWAGLATVKGYLDLICNNGRPFAISDKDITLFKAFLADDPAAKAAVGKALQPGDQVMVKSGPFRDFEALIETVDDERGRAIIEVMIFGRSSPVDVELAQIIKL